MFEYKPKKGRKGFPLTESMKEELGKIITENQYSLPEMARSVGLTLIQLRRPLLDGGQCSRYSLQRIERFLSRYRRKQQRAANES